MMVALVKEVHEAAGSSIMETVAPIRVLSLLSGGLDSQLAVCVLRAQGLDVHGLAFVSPFFGDTNPRRAAAQLGIPLHLVDFTDDIVGLVEHPPHGFGGGLNPCIDCHARMLRRAGERLEEFGARFLSTGEVLNERPMSQNMRSLGLVADASGYGDLIVRPLSALLLPETRPEREGWVDRQRLLALEGRGRKAQFQLAETYGLKQYPTPAGGCRLTEPNYVRRLRELKQHEGLRDARSLGLLLVGRHFRLADGSKLIVGRDQRDNNELERIATPADLLLTPLPDVPGPSALLPAGADPEAVQLATRICASYADGAALGPVTLCVRCGGVETRVTVAALARADAVALML